MSQRASVKKQCHVLDSNRLVLKNAYQLEILVPSLQLRKKRTLSGVSLCLIPAERLLHRICRFFAYALPQTCKYRSCASAKHMTEEFYQPNSSFVQVSGCTG